MRAFGAMDLEEAFDLRQDPLERPGLVVVERDRVAMHRIAGPDDLAALPLDRADEAWQMVGNLVVAEAADQRQPPGFVGRVEDVDQLRSGRPPASDGPHFRPIGFLMPRQNSTWA